MNVKTVYKKKNNGPLSFPQDFRQKEFPQKEFPQKELRQSFS